MKHLVVAINWYGPFSVDDAVREAKGFANGLYVGIGKVKYQHGAPMPQYIGLSKNLSSRLANHHKIPRITRDALIWLGEIASANVPGKHVKKTPETLSLAEWAHAYFLKLPLNERKRKSPPDKPVTVVNRWWQKDGETLRRHRPHPAWPDFIGYLDPELPARLVWFGGKQTRVSPPFVSG